MSTTSGISASSRGGEASVIALNDADSTLSQTPLMDSCNVSEDAGDKDVSGSSHNSPHVTLAETGNALGTTPVVPNAWNKRPFSSVIKPQVIPNRTSSPSFTVSEIRRQHSTFVIRRAPPDMSPQKAIQTIAEQMRIPPGALFESVLRDPQDRRRLYLVFKSPQIKDEVAAKGFRLGNVVIKPTDGALHGYIPFPPFFIDHQSLVIALSRHGQVTSHKFVTTSDGIRVAGFQFQLKLKPNASPPREIRYGGRSMAIRYADDIRKCDFCHNYGHTIRFCHKRATAESERQLRASLRADAPVMTQAENTEKTTAEAEKENKLKKLWWSAQDQLVADEETTIDELLMHTYCQMTSLSGISKKLSDTTDAEALADIIKTVADDIEEQWRKEWVEIRRRFHQNRVDDHATFLAKGMPPTTPAHPLAMITVPAAPPEADYTKLVKNEDRIKEYCQKFGFEAELTKKVNDLLEEIADDEDEDMESEIDEDEERRLQTENASKSNSPQVVTPPASVEETFPPSDWSYYRNLLPKSYSKIDCEYAFKVEAKTSLHRIKHSIWLAIAKICGKPGYDHINPVSIMPVDCGNFSYIIYVPDLPLAEQVRTHLLDPVIKTKLQISKIGSAKQNKSFRSSAQPT